APRPGACPAAAGMATLARLLAGARVADALGPALPGDPAPPATCSAQPSPRPDAHGREGQAAGAPPAACPLPPSPSTRAGGAATAQIQMQSQNGYSASCTARPAWTDRKSTRLNSSH